VCALAACGNGILEVGEQCDFGPGNGPGTGCEGTCAFSCTTAPDSCPDANLCNGTEACTQVMVNAQVGQACSPGVALPACAPCPGGVCGGGACLASACGDGCLDPGNGEQCEPPGSSGCSATCTNPNCGNGVREGAEQCDDGNLTNLDGCDSACSFEQNERMNWFKLQFTTDAYCVANALGTAFVGASARTQFQQSLDSGIASGAISVMFKITGLDDLTGANDPVVELGTVSGAPETGMGMLPYDGTNDLDWWYNVDPSSIDANRNPTSFLPASMTAGVMNAGPGSLALTLLLLGNPAPLHMSNVNLNVTVGSSGAPLASAGGPPGHLASENLDPALVSYVGAGLKTAIGSGKLCGNISALSLSLVPIPPSLAAGGALPCSQGYTVSNSMLDLLVGGCTVFFPQIAAKQPDQQDPGVPPAGAGAPYTLEANAQRVVTTCRDASAQVVNLAECLEDAAFSSFFKFATGRVIVK
jgi:cysteine-rich repeat protein